MRSCRSRYKSTFSLFFSKIKGKMSSPMSVEKQKEDDDYIYEDHLLPAWLREEILDSAYDSEEEGSRPLRFKWPKSSALTRDHFTIDVQTCVDCSHALGWMMPMNKKPNSRYLFCHNDVGEQTCGLSPYLRCYYCGNINNSNSGSIVYRTANSAYDGPSQHYQFMCYHCHKEQKENEPGLEECKKQMAAIRELRREDEAKYRLEQRMGGGGAAASKTYTSYTSHCSSKSAVKKRKLAAEEDVTEE